MTYSRLPLVVKEAGMTELMPGAEPFFHEGNDVGCLLLHGFTGTPQEMRRLGEYLNKCGFTVRGPLVAGHGTRVQELHGTSWRDWHESTYQSLRSLNGPCSRVFAIGLSLGGALALHLAAHVPLSGVVTMATPLMVDPKLLWLARVVKYALRYCRKGPSNILNAQALGARVAYDHLPIRGTEQVLRFFRHLHDDLPEVHTPALLIHSQQDKTVHPKMMSRIFERLGAEEKRMMWLENSGHIVTEVCEREVVYRAIESFIEEHI
jgi:carboxylesterase